MSSVTRFLRQIPTGQSVYLQGTVVNVNDLAAIANAAVEFIPTSGNYVGNYPPGVVVAASAALKAAIQTADAGLAQSTPVIRDLGKTIFAPVYNGTPAATGTASGNSGFFRQVQLLIPQAIGSQGFIGGAQGSVFGVVGGSPDAYSSYLTFYLPTAVAGVLATAGFATTVTPLFNSPQGQM